MTNGFLRVADCGLRSVSLSPALVIQEYAGREHHDTEELQGKSERGLRAAWWSGVLRCGRQHSCPVCAAQRAAERAGELDRMMRADVDGRWQMLTLTMRHSRADALADSLDRLVAAWRRCRSTRLVREIMDRRVTASVRAIEVTFSFANGWHPHIHVLWRTEEWSPEERAILAREWLRALGDDAAPVDVALHWSRPIGAWCAERASYLSKLGAELAGVGKMSHNRPSLTPWQLAERGFRDRWREYQVAMKGRRTLEMDERAKVLRDAAPDVGPKLMRELSIVLHGEEFRDVARCELDDPEVWELLFESAEGPWPWEQLEELVRATVHGFSSSGAQPWLARDGPVHDAA